MWRSVVWAVGLVLLSSSGATADEPPAAPADVPAQDAAPAAVYDPALWEPQVEKVRAQFDLLDLFGKVTQMTGVTIKIPKEVQRIPLEDPKETGIELFLREVEFHDAAFSYNEEPSVVDNHPVLGALAAFSRIGLAVTVKKGPLVFPVAAEFRSGELPFDFDVTQDGYALNVIPEARAAEAQLDNVSVDLGGPVAQRVLSKVFGGELARLVLRFAAGQAFQMDKNALLPLGGMDTSSLRKINSVLGDVLKSPGK